MARIHQFVEEGWNSGLFHLFGGGNIPFVYGFKSHPGEGPGNTCISGTDEELVAAFVRINGDKTRSIACIQAPRRDVLSAITI